MPRLLGYAFGKSLDPVVRLSSIMRRLTAWGKDVEAHLVTNQTIAEKEPIPGFSHYVCAAEPKAIVAKLRELIERVDPTLLLVDRHVVGVAGELPGVLPAFDCARVLVQGYVEENRTAPPADLEDAARRSYDLCLAPADLLGYREHGRTLQTDPIVSFEPSEFLAMVDARTLLRHAGKPIFVFHEEAGVRLYESLKKACPTSGGLRIDWRLATQDMTLDARFPGECIHRLSYMNAMPAVAAVIAPPHYSIFYETQSAGTPALFTGSTQQAERIGRRVGPLFVSDPRVLAKRILQGDLPEPTAPKIFGGARHAARELRSLIGARSGHDRALECAATGKPLE
jgi:hypothetical protein